MEEESKEGFKRCSKCGRVLPITEFHKDKSKKDGLRSECKECTKAYNVEYYQANKEKIADYYNQQTHPMGWARNMIAQYRRMDRDRGFDDSQTITAEWFLQNIAYRPCVHCGKQGIGLIGCNRLDNTKGHTEDNVEPCCNKCNARENIRDQIARGIHISQIRKKIAFSDFVKEHLNEKSKK